MTHPLLLPFIAVLLVVGAACAQEADLALPPDADGAAKALADSPRHGEWVDVPLPGSDVKIKSWVVYPERSDPAPVVIVIHEIYGMTDWVRGVADQLAAEGYVAIAPDLLSGMAPNGGGTESLGADVRETIRKLTPADSIARLNAVRDYAAALPSTTTRSACVGFCWGGSTSFLYAAGQPELDAAVVYYGTAPDSVEALKNIRCPVLGLYGGDDARVTSTVAATAEQMKDLGKAYSSHIYDGAGHAFLRQQSWREGANLKASQQAWAATLAFFRERLAAKE